MAETVLLRIKGERKALALLEYYRIIITDQRIIIARTSRGRTKLAALTPKFSKFDRMTPEEVLNADKNNFAINHNDAILKGGLIGGAVIVPNRERKMLKIGIMRGDFKKLKDFLDKKGSVKP